MTHQPSLISDQPSPEDAGREAERAEYLARLREKLKDPEFRAIGGFPIGEDESILALSDPPYYTACPNPFLPEIMARWQAERTQLRSGLSLPDDTAENGNGNPDQLGSYHREPFAADVAEGKNDPVYNAHSYHTKVPHKAIMRYILHYTEPGDVVLDGFCGSGMTGVAAHLCSDGKAVESLGYRVQADGAVLDEVGQAFSHLGPRKAVLIDLSPVATFVAYNYNTPVDVHAFQREATRVLQDVKDELGWMYETSHIGATTGASINYMVWSDVFVCPQCAREILYWHETVNLEESKVTKVFPCPGCGFELSRVILERAWTSLYDDLLDCTVRQAKRIPTLISYTVGKKRYEKEPDASDTALLERIQRSPLRHRAPLVKIEKGDKTSDPLGVGFTHVHHYYTRRSLAVLATFADLSRDSEISRPLLFTLTSGLDRISLRNGYRPQHRNNKSREVGGPLPGNLYIPIFSTEINPLRHLETRIAAIARMYGAVSPAASALVSTQSTSGISIPDDSVDYIFVDPPFGSNLMYSELNHATECWIGVRTENQPEAIVNNSQEKGFAEYRALMESCFGEMFRVLRPGRWITVEFHNSQNAIWNAIQEALLKVGFVIADVRSLGKNLGTLNQISYTNAVRQDLIISAYKPRTGFQRRFLDQVGSGEGVWIFIRQHLEHLPIVVEAEGALEIVTERQAYLLYDRMVAFHIQRGFSVPLDAAEFYIGLRQRFPERDGMYFLPHQAAEYDRRRLEVGRVGQLALFVTDEKSAIQWLQRELDSTVGAGPQTYQEIQPKFLRELHQARHEKLPELRDLLEQNFLADEHDRWYVPDPARQEDLEKLRERTLLREFQEYAQGKGRLKIFRTEAVRAGFKHAWRERAYQLIVQVAQRLPESVLQEDAGLLMYYDNALMRAEGEPVQGRLL